MKNKINSRIGGQANDIFSSTNNIKPVVVEKSKIQQKPQEKLVGRPKQIESTIKSTVTFLNSQIVWLDRLSTDIRSSSMAIIDRGTLIRAIITAIEESRIDLSCATSEEEVRNIILEGLSGHKKR